MYRLVLILLLSITTALTACAREPGALAGAADLGAEWPGGFFCPCHRSRFDLAGRVFKAVPAPLNLEIPPHTYLSATRLLIGQDRT